MRGKSKTRNLNGTGKHGTLRKNNTEHKLNLKARNTTELMRGVETELKQKIYILKYLLF